MSGETKQCETAIQEKASAVERALVQGDLAGLSESERIVFYRQVCDSLGLNHLTRPFDYIKLNGKLQLYAKKDCAEQLRRNYSISLKIIERAELDGIYEVTAQAKMPDGRIDEEIGAVNVKGLQGDALANAHMKAVTKAKRRVTLSICGLGFLDESEISGIPNAEVIQQSPTPTQIEHKQEATLADGAELEACVRKRDAQFAAEGRCAPGELIRHICKLGVEGGFDPQMVRWGPEAIGMALRWGKEFRNTHPRKQAEAAPSNGHPTQPAAASSPIAAPASSRFVTPEKAKELQELMHRKGRHFARKEKGDAGEAVCRVFDLPETTMIEDLTPFQYAEIRKALLEERDFVRS